MKHKGHKIKKSNDGFSLNWNGEKKLFPSLDRAKYFIDLSLNMARGGSYFSFEQWKWYGKDILK